jgi:hypothetical protein
MSLKDIFEIPLPKVLCYISFASACFIPGTLLVFIYKRELFSVLAFPNLLLLIIAISFPLLFINTLMVWGLIPGKMLRTEPYMLLLLGSTTNYFVFAIVLLCYYIFRITLERMIFLLVALESVISFSVSIFGKKIKCILFSMPENENNGQNT